jgi:hypothetical protein
MPVKSRENNKPSTQQQQQPRPQLGMSDARLEAVVEAAYVLDARTR